MEVVHQQQGNYLNPNPFVLCCFPFSVFRFLSSYIFPFLVEPVLFDLVVLDPLVFGPAAPGPQVFDPGGIGFPGIGPASA